MFPYFVPGKVFTSTISKADIMKKNTERSECINIKIPVWTKQPFQKVQAINKL